MRFPLILSLLVFALSCAKKTKITAQPHFGSISMHKSGCYGTCPVYDLNINGDGDLILHAHHFMEIEGEFHGKLSASDLSFLQSAANALNWTDFRSEYMSGLSDIPSTELSHAIDTTVTQLRFEYGHAPEALETFTRNLEMIVDTTSWVPAAN